MKNIPPKGWNSWDCYGTTVTEEIVRNNAEYMAKHLKQYGWEYIVVDIQWYEPTALTHEYHPFTELCMDEYSRLIPAENRFPSSAGGKGFKPLADFVHSLGLKFGIHIMRGIPRQAVHRNTKILGTEKTARMVAKSNSICFWNTDMYGVNPDAEGAREYYDSIFKLYAEWGVDFIKCDDIARELPHAESELIMISEALRSCGREMVFSISPGASLLDKAELYKTVCNMWRITDDFWDEWHALYNMFSYAEKWSIHSGNCHWPDADMLPIGSIRQDYNVNETTAFTHEEQRTMMTLWGIFRSPLMIGGEMTKFDDFTLNLVTNQDILRMNENSRNAHQVWRRVINGVEHVLWTANSKDGGHYFALFNIGNEDSEIKLDLSDLEIEGKIEATELWSGKTDIAENSVNISIKSHDAKAYYFKNI